MPAYRYPILLLRDAAGLHTALLVEDGGDVGAVSASPSDAVSQLKDYLEKQHRQNEWLPEPDFEEAELAVLRVDVRAEYRSEERPYPCSETIAVRVPVVTGKTESGLRVGSLPTMSMRFTYYEAADLKPLVTQYVQAKLRGHSPAGVARHLSAAEARLDEVVIQVRRPAKERAEKAELKELEAVADALGSREQRARYSRAWEREELVAKLVEALRREKSPILLVGESGVGKTAILAEAARKIERDGDAPEQRLMEDVFGEGAGVDLKKVSRFWMTSAPRLIAGMQYLGMWQERLENVIGELSSIAGVLCCENMLEMAKTGGQGPGDSLAAFLAPYLQRAEVRLVSEATPGELDALRRLIPALADVFQIIQVPSFSRAESVSALTQMANVKRQSARVEFERPVIETVHRLFSRFMPYHPFPGKTVGFMQELFEQAARERRSVLTAADAVGLFVRQTGLPEVFLRDELPLETAQVVTKLRADVIGQDGPCEAAAAVVTTFKAGLNDPARPLGVFLFCGPTGVGKTQLALSLAKLLYGASGDEQKSALGAGGVEARLVRVDLSEYAGADAADRFLGTEQSGPAEWILKVRRQPFCVLLLDEIEKASPEVFDVLLNVFDEGRLTDPWGRVTWFRSAVIIMTSNLGVSVGRPFGLSALVSAQKSAEYDHHAASFFRPEFFNRIDAVLSFAALSRETIRSIARKELEEIQKREGLERANLRLVFSEAVVEEVAKAGFDERYGARPLQRAVESLVVTPLAKFLVEQAGVRDGVVRVELGVGGVGFELS